MKVKKKYIYGCSLSLLVLIILVLGLFLLFLSKFNISMEDGQRLVKSGFSIDPAANSDIDDYSTISHKTIDVLHYEIHLDLFPEIEEIKSRVIIRGQIKDEDAKNIELNFNDGFDVSGVKLNKSEIDYNYTDDKIIFSVPDKLKGEFTIQIDYSGTPESLGFGSFTFGEYNEKPVVYSLNEPIFASTWFPCNDTPSDKVLADIYITNDSSMTSISNGILISTTENLDRKTYHWKSTYPISTYLISIYSADYVNYQEKYISNNSDTMKLDYYVFEDHLEDAKKDFSIHKNAITHLSNLFGEYPFIKEKYGVAEFLWSFGAMEHQTISGIGEKFVTGNKTFTGMLVHELAHQWWGNAVTLDSWKDIWLNEGFATYSEALYWEKEKGFSRLKSTMRSFNTNFDGTTLYNPEKLFSRIIYNKGAWVLHMLRREVGEQKFSKILKDYYSTYKYKNVTTDEFIKLAEEVSDRDLTQFFTQWVYKGNGKIELEYNYDQNTDLKEYEIVLKLNQIQDGYSNYNFILDLDFYLDNGTKVRKFIRVSEKESKNKFIFKNRITKIDLDPDNWLAAKIQFLEPKTN